MKNIVPSLGVLASLVCLMFGIMPIFQATEKPVEWISSWQTYITAHHLMYWWLGFLGVFILVMNVRKFGK